MLVGRDEWAKKQGYRHFDFGGIPRRDAELMIRGEPLPEAFQRSPGAFKREFVPAPSCSLGKPATNPVARVLVRSVCPLLLRPEGIRWVVQRLRSGRSGCPTMLGPMNPRT